MFTRRQLLGMTLAGVGAAGTVVGVDRSVLQGTVYEKWVRGYDPDGSELVHSVVLDSLETPYVVDSIDDLDLFDGRSGRRPVITDDAHVRLLERYESVEYGIDVCSGDARRECHGGAIDRDGFNAVQIADEVTVAQVRNRVRLLRTAD
ncbi:hypothetical protein [Natrarchaeobaculum aegyptiacum]|uniref:Uncharacterized protein n=1 Tax=Natrarchaeobaculum aegyptiacum TaxID=745377 RepID=A0A2Z2HTD7_9EURY|nr:hypothetical protein [Natrarchaeobaculum aegyptiacum]ARS90053.1 hypothetical protein B1756_10150 [Natrarchaeobaculum aegyptiacum]